MTRSLARNITLVNRCVTGVIENSSGGWTRTSTSQLQRLVGCQLPNAGILAVASREIAAAAAVRTRYRPNRDGGIGGPRAPAGRNGTGDPVRLNALDRGFHSVHLVRCLRNREADGTGVS